MSEQHKPTTEGKSSSVPPGDQPARDQALDAREKFERAEKALETVNEATGTVRNFYFTFLLLGAYIGVTTASTTDEQLLRISPVTLPLLDVELPILGFYIIIPWLFLLLHFNLLIHFALLARKLRVFERYTAGLQEGEVAALKERLSNFPFVHMLIGQQHDFFMRLLMTLIIVITAVALPLILLLWVQIGFLPYHDPGITWTHRTAVLIDILLVALFWPRLVSDQGALAWWKKRFLRLITLFWYWPKSWMTSRKNQELPPPATFWRSWCAERGKGALFAIMVMLTTACMSLMVATVPDEKWEKTLLSYMPESWIEKRGRDFFWPTYVLFEDDALFHRNLYLRDKVLTAHVIPAEAVTSLLAGGAKYGKQASRIAMGINLQRRDLRYANLFGAILTNANLRLARLQGANLMKAQLQGADMRGARLQKAVLVESHLQGVDLQRSYLQGSDLRRARLHGANLRQARLQGANLWEARLQGADLKQARLQAADLRKARLQGVDLREASIGGSYFRDARLDFADLRSLHRTVLTEEDYQEISEELERVMINAERRASILKNLKKGIGRKDTLNKAASADQCLSNEPKLFARCMTEDQLPQYQAVQAKYLVKLACDDSDTANGIAQRFSGYGIKTEDSYLAEVLMSADCMAVNELPEDIKENLKEVAERASPSPTE